MSLMKAESMEHVIKSMSSARHTSAGARLPRRCLETRKEAGRPHEDDHAILQPLGRVDGLNLYPWFTYPPFRMVFPSPPGARAGGATKINPERQPLVASIPPCSLGWSRASNGSKTGARDFNTCVGRLLVKR